MIHVIHVTCPDCGADYRVAVFKVKVRRACRVCGEHNITVNVVASFDNLDDDGSPPSAPRSPR